MLALLLAEAATTASNMMDAPSIGTLIGSLLVASGLSSGVSGLVCYRQGKRAGAPVNLTNSPLIVDKAAAYATTDDLTRTEAGLLADIQDIKQEMSKVEADLLTHIRELKERQGQDTRDIYTRLNGITIKLNEVSGKQDLMIELLKQPRNKIQS